MKFTNHYKCVMISKTIRNMKNAIGGKKAW